MSSKLIVTILSYTVSKLVRFFETQCILFVTTFPPKLHSQNSPMIPWLFFHVQGNPQVFMVCGRPPRQRNDASKPGRLNIHRQIYKLTNIHIQIYTMSLPVHALAPYVTLETRLDMGSLPRQGIHYTHQRPNSRSFLGKF